MLIEQYIERTIYHAMREKLVVEGWLPDIMNYDVENPDPNIAKAAVDSYYAQMKTIANNKKFAIEVFNFGSNQTKGMKKVPRIVIDTLQFLPGMIGNDTTPQYVKNEETGYYTRETSESIRSDLNFNIYAVGNTSEQMRVMNNLIVSVFPKRGYIKTLDNSQLQLSGNFFVRMIDAQKDDDLPEGVMERIFRFEIPDLNEIDNQVLEGNISPMKEITTEITVNDSPSSSLIVE